MPSRKAQHGDSSASSGHGSMRRLSSIASLHQLLPFSRGRRSDHGFDSLSSSSPPSSSVFTASTSTISSVTEQNASQVGHASTRAEPSHPRSGRMGCREPQTSLPRSRTFSNLPLPTRARPSKQHKRQQSIASEQTLVVPGTTRLPTPTGSTRRYLPFGYRNERPSGSSGAGKLKRSDTEPLLPFAGSHKPYHRTGSFKENLPIADPSPPAGLFGSSVSSSVLCSSPDSSSRIDASPSLPRERSFCGAVPVTPVKAKSSPINALANDKTPTQASYLAATAPVLRHHHALTDISNSYRGYQKLPANSKASTKQDIDQPLIPWRSYRMVYEDQPTSYWSGRLSSLLDLYQSQELSASFDTNGTIAIRTETDKLYAPATTTARARRAFEELYATCATDEAKESFVRFQLQYAALHNDAELAKAVGPHASRAKIHLSSSAKSAKTTTSESGGHVGGSGRKPSFVDRLLGRGKRNSLTGG